MFHVKQAILRNRLAPAIVAKEMRILVTMHLTNGPDSGHDSPVADTAAGAPEDEIDILPEMIRAAADSLMRIDNEISPPTAECFGEKIF